MKRTMKICWQWIQMKDNWQLKIWKQCCLHGLGLWWCRLDEDYKDEYEKDLNDGDDDEEEKDDLDDDDDDRWLASEKVCPIFHNSTSPHSHFCKKTYWPKSVQDCIWWHIYFCICMYLCYLYRTQVYVSVAKYFASLKQTVFNQSHSKLCLYLQKQKW